MSGDPPPSAPTLAQRLAAIERLENELVRKAQAILPDGGVSIVDFFILSATQRTLSQSAAFRMLIKGRNFSSAAVLLRTQIDTAMRINGLRFLDNPDQALQRVFKGERTPSTSWPCVLPLRAARASS